MRWALIWSHFFLSNFLHLPVLSKKLHFNFMFHCLASRPVQGAPTSPSAQAIAQLRMRDETVNLDSRLLGCCHRSPLAGGPAVPPAVKLKLEIF